MQVSEKNALKTVVEEKMRKMFFSQPVINRYFDSVSQKELISMNTLLDDEQEVRRVSRRARYIKTANFPTMKSFDDYDFSGIKFPKNFSKEDMLSLDFIEKKLTIVFSEVVVQEKLMQRQLSELKHATKITKLSSLH